MDAFCQKWTGWGLLPGLLIVFSSIVKNSHGFDFTGDVATHTSIQPAILSQGEIHGTHFQDSDGDGSQDPDEPGLGGQLCAAGLWITSSPAIRVSHSRGLDALSAGMPRTAHSCPPNDQTHGRQP